ncbi:MAG: energy transducer TonB [Chitinophagales bacterium]
MEPLAILHADSLDLLFENRNKLYGAYPLRKYYNRRLYSAMAAVIGIVLVFCVCVIYWKSGTGFSARSINTPPVILTSIPLSPEVRPLQAAKPAGTLKHGAVKPFTTLLIVRDPAVIKPMATMNELNAAAIGMNTIAGPEVPEADHSSAGPSGTLVNPLKDSVNTTPKILDRAEVMPEFPGGAEALKRFLLKNLRMPETGIEAGSQVLVIAKFVVGPDGKVSGIETIVSGGDAFDGEVKRVIHRMPDWKPGMQRHQKVAVYFNLPVYFVVPEEN